MTPQQMQTPSGTKQRRKEGHRSGLDILRLTFKVMAPFKKKKKKSSLTSGYFQFKFSGDTRKKKVSTSTDCEFHRRPQYFKPLTTDHGTHVRNPSREFPPKNSEPRFFIFFCIPSSQMPRIVALAI